MNLKEHHTVASVVAKSTADMVTFLEKESKVKKLIR